MPKAQLDLFRATVAATAHSTKYKVGEAATTRANSDMTARL